MTPKEKAKQLFESFEDDLMESDVYFLEAAKKRCALIAVNELIKNEYQLVDELLNIIQDNKIKLVVSLPNRSYWESVKIEIEKIEIKKL